MRRDSGDVVVYELGRAVRHVSENEARSLGLTVVNLGDQWAPALFDEAPELGEAGHQPYRETFLALASEHFGDGPEWERARQDRYLELYGIFPTLTVVRRRLLDEERHRCHDAVDDTLLGRSRAPLVPWAAIDKQRERLRLVDRYGRRLDDVRAHRNLASNEELASDRRWGMLYRKWSLQRVPSESIRAMQDHLRCEHLLSRNAPTRIFELWTAQGLKSYQRRHMVVSWGVLDPDTRDALTTDSRELDFRTLLRVLRERVVSATGLIEDGSARGELGTVMGRILDAQEMRVVERYRAMPNGAPDLISAATDTAARALGWNSPEAARAWLEHNGEGVTGSLRIAVRLPPPPRYHSAHMELRAVIDRGDVWYQFPFTGNGNPRFQPERRRPTLTLLAKDGANEIALIRWNTTIGHWKPEKLASGGVVMRYKGSDTGTRVWRDIIASPAWLPPETTPNEDLVRREAGRPWRVNSDLFGPGYHSAYGLAMMVHHDPPAFWDRGIRTHGSVSYQSILRGHSHGCHRLFNHLAVRLSSFLVTHRNVARHGNMRVRYARNFWWRGRDMRLRIGTRGYLYELTPPVEVRVLEGRIRGTPRHPPRAARLLPSALAARALAEEAASEGE